MTFLTDDEAIEAIKKHEPITPALLSMREKSKELKALVNGEDFIDELLEKIEFIESDKKAKARIKFSRSIQDTYARIFQPIDNIYYATGGVKEYDIESPELKKKYISKIANIRDGKTLSEWIQTKGIQIFNTDPNGLIFLEYKTQPTIDVYPTYKSINSVRHYESHGQQVEFVLFEPYVLNEKYHYRIVDDLYDRTFIKDGQTWYIEPNLSFKHPFGQCPALVCSNVSYVGKKEKLPAINNIIGLSKELARDQSILTLYKIFKGLPLFWKVVQMCGDCQGTGKSGDEVCGVCNGHGKYVGKNDVTDVIEVPLPEGEEKLLTGDNIGGYLSPELDTWKKLEETIDKLEEKMYKSHWGTSFGMKINGNVEKTATEVIFDKQPFENQLNKYADYVEYIEWKLSEWILNLFDQSKDKQKSLITINLGRRYIIESYDVLLDRYELAVKAQCNSVILDKIFEEFLYSKFRNNPIDLQISLAKAKVEPYLHYTIDNTLLIFGNEEAQRKMLFNKFWQTVTQFSNTEKLINDYNVWFEANKIEDPAVVKQKMDIETAKASQPIVKETNLN
jgi:hypothetical protein